MKYLRLMLCILCVGAASAQVQETKPPVYYYNASWSPDGSKVRKVADGGTVSNPVVSRDGKYFVYTKKARGQWGVYVYDIACKEERLLISD
jgi:Tol biopolymer transport system component